MKSYALQAKDSRGRLFQEKNADFRSPFQRDRDRIVHSTAFRRLAAKTQVFQAQEGDLFRSRLTHSLEVALVARALARRLDINEDLAESVALAHDLGHPPFGHTGEEALEKVMKDYGGFDHNAQAMRIVTKLEERYASFEGLNLTWEVLEGMAKHNGPCYKPLPWALSEANAKWDLELSTHSSLEAQIAAIADDIAYNHHDLQDGLRSGLILDEEVQEIPILKPCFAKILKEHPKAPTKIIRYEALSLFFSSMVNDIHTQTMKNLEFSPQNADDIRHANRQIVRFSDDYFQELKVLRKFLFERLYRHEMVMRMREIASEMIEISFAYAFENIEVLPKDWRKNADLRHPTTRARLVSDYISGMTDVFLARDWFFVHQKSLPPH